MKTANFLPEIRAAHRCSLQPALSIVIHHKKIAFSTGLIDSRQPKHETITRCVAHGGWRIAILRAGCVSLRLHPSVAQIDENAQ